MLLERVSKQIVLPKGFGIVLFLSGFPTDIESTRHTTKHHCLFTEQIVAKSLRKLCRGRGQQHSVILALVLGHPFLQLEILFRVERSCH